MSELDGIYEHLNELRTRVLRVAIVVGIIAVFLMTFHLEPISYNEVILYYPIPDPLDNIAAQLTNYFKINLVPEGVQLIQTAPGQAFFAQIYIAALVGLVTGTPVIIREIVSFLKPALKENEVNVGRTITAPIMGLFISGCLFAYFVVIQFMFEFLFYYGASSGLVTFLNIMEFATFVLQILLAFGLSFQLPVIMYAISQTGMTDAKFWRKNIRYAIIVIVIFGALVTPDGSGVTMWFIAGPMIGLYLAGMILVERKEKQTVKT